MRHVEVISTEPLSVQWVEPIVLPRDIETETTYAQLRRHFPSVVPMGTLASVDFYAGMWTVGLSLPEPQEPQAGRSVLYCRCDRPMVGPLRHSAEFCRVILRAVGIDPEKAPDLTKLVEVKPMYVTDAERDAILALRGRDV